MPDVYISRSGMENKELDERFASTELGEIKRENEKLKTELGIAKAGFESELNEMKKEQDDKIRELSFEVRNMFNASKKSSALNTVFLNATEKNKRVGKGMRRYLKKETRGAREQQLHP